MANLVVHFEIHASEPQRLVDLYTRLLGLESSPGSATSRIACRASAEPATCSIRTTTSSVIDLGRHVRRHHRDGRRPKLERGDAGRG